MSKSLWKFSSIESSIYKQIFLNKFKNIKPNKYYCRGSTVPQFLAKKSVHLYKGNIFSKINLLKYNVGYKIGEFSITRKPFRFPLKNKKNKR